MGIWGKTVCRKPSGDSNGCGPVLEASDVEMVEIAVGELSVDRISFTLMVSSVVDNPSPSIVAFANSAESLSSCSADRERVVRVSRKDLSASWVIPLRE